MKMKKIVYISFFVGALGLNSCSSILDTPPTSTPSESVYWQSKADFESALTACYPRYARRNFIMDHSYF